MKKASSELLLPDINVLLALAWPNHQLNRRARERFVSSRERWATCAVTQLGFIRLSSNPAAVWPARRPSEAAQLLAEIVDDPMHTYLDVQPSPLDPAWNTFSNALGPNQVMDAYLLQVAKAHRAILVTFDKRLRALSPGVQEIDVLEP